MRFLAVFVTACFGTLATAQEPPASAPETAPGSVLAVPKLDEPKSGFRLRATLDHSFGTGMFVRDETLRQSRNYIAQSWDVQPSYGFEFKGHILSLRARLSLEYEYTTPDGNARRWKPSDTLLSLGDLALYEVPVVGVTLGGSVRAIFPTSFESLRTKSQWGGAGATVSASRSFGKLWVSYVLGATKYFNSESVTTSYASVAREATASAPSGVTPMDDPTTVPLGYGNTSFVVSNSFEVEYGLTELLSLRYSGTLRNYFRYNVGPSEADAFTSPFADSGRGRRDEFLSSLSVSYELSQRLADTLPLPFELYVAGGMAARHPAQTTDNRSVLWPLFWPAFADNRAAQNYGSFYVDLVGLY